MPDDIGFREYFPRGRSAEPPADLTSLYEGEEIPKPHRKRHAPDSPGSDEQDKNRGTAEKKRDKAEPQAPARRRLKLVVLAVLGAALLIAAIAFGVYWYTTLRWFESTDDAYTQADNTIVAPRVSGYVSELLVTDNQSVKAGDLLLRIDPRDYQAAVKQAQADVQAAEAGIKNIDAQIALQQSNIAQARTDITSAQANLTFARQEAARYQALVRTGAGTVQRAQQAQSGLLDKTAALQRAEAALASATKQLPVLQTQRGQAEATLEHNRAVLQQAQLNLGYTAVTAPIDGAIGNRTVQIGQYVQPGTQLMTIVPMGDNIYVVANFKETQLARMFRGEKVELTVDTFPDVTLHGMIDSLAPGSGAQFALLPPENATGNFTKIVQRVPVKIRIDSDNDPIIKRLRPGLSVTADVDTRTAPPNGTQTLVPAGAR